MSEQQKKELENAMNLQAEAQGIAGVAAAVQTAQDFVRFVRQVHQAATLHGLHDDDGFPVLFAHLVDLAALDVCLSPRIE